VAKDCPATATAVCEIHLIPAFLDLVALAKKKRRAGEAHLLQRSGKTETVTHVGHGGGPQNGDLVPLCDDVIHGHVNVWKDFAELSADGRKLLRTVDDGIRLRESNGSSVAVVHLHNG
jgi:hypothetical protein